MKIQQTPTTPTLTRASVLYQGPALCGKTHHMATWPSPFFIVFDPKLETLRKVAPGVPYIVPSSFEEFREEIVPYITGGKLAAEYPQVETIAIDTLSFAASWLELELAGKGDDVPWRVFAGRLSSVLAKLMELVNHTDLPRNYHIVAGVHEKEIKEQIQVAGKQQSRTLAIEPLIAGKMASLIRGYFDLTLLPYSEKVQVPSKPGQPAVVETRHLCRAVPIDRYRAAGGTLWGRTLPETVDGTFPGLLKACGLTESDVPKGANIINDNEKMENK